VNLSYIIRVSKNSRPKRFPSVRFYGHKVSYANLISKIIMNLHPKTFLEAFGGTGVVSYILSSFCRTTYIDLFEFCCTWARALIGYSNVSWKILEKMANVEPRYGFISREFEGMYFEEEENAWLDGFMSKIWELKKPERDVAVACITQACIAKRPFGAFHRVNLYFRRKRVRRSFGNWITWNRDFKELYLRFLNEIKQARKHVNIHVIRENSFSYSKDADVIYADPPFIGERHYVDYLKLYHFIEGLARWDVWEDLIDKNTSLKHLSRREYPEFKKSNAKEMLKLFFKTCECNAIVFSWVLNGYPTPSWIIKELKKRWGEVAVIGIEKPVYLKGHNIELLIVACDKAKEIVNESLSGLYDKRGEG